MQRKTFRRRPKRSHLPSRETKSDDEAEDTVIEPGPDEAAPEPTIEAPVRKAKPQSADDEVEEIIKEYNKE